MVGGDLAYLRRRSPAALAWTKALLRASTTTSFGDQLRAEIDAFAAGAATEDFAEGLDAFFAKPRPVFRGH